MRTEHGAARRRGTAQRRGTARRRGAARARDVDGRRSGGGAVRQGGRGAVMTTAEAREEGGFGRTSDTRFEQGARERERGRAGRRPRDAARFDDGSDSRSPHADAHARTRRPHRGVCARRPFDSLVLRSSPAQPSDNTQPPRRFRLRSGFGLVHGLNPTSFHCSGRTFATNGSAGDGWPTSPPSAAQTDESTRVFPAVATRPNVASACVAREEEQHASFCYTGRFLL